MIEPDPWVSIGAIDLQRLRARASPAGRRRRVEAPRRTGRYVRAVAFRPRERVRDLAVDATLRAAALRGPAGAVVTVEDLRRRVRLRNCASVVVFLVDASDSMGTAERMATAKGAVLALLTYAYQSRDRVGLVAFRDEGGRVLLPPTKSVALARERLRTLAVGGATPFADGLRKAWDLLRVARVKDPDAAALLVILSDGEANVPAVPGRRVMAELLEMADRIRRDRVRTVVVDTKHGPPDARPMVALARAFGASYHHRSRLEAAALVEVVREGPSGRAHLEVSERRQP